MRRVSICLLVFAFFLAGFHVVSAETAALWSDFVTAKREGREPVLPDFSFAGYHFSEKPIPDVSQRPRFDVTQYGATPNDDTFDDDGIQRAIETAEASQGGVVFFPPGRFLIAGDDNRRRSIRISQSNIVLKGSGAGEGGSEIFMDKMRIGRRQIRFGPRRTTGDELATITKDAPRESFWVEVDDPTDLIVGQNVVIRHQSEEFTRLYFDPLPLAREWRRLFGRRGGMNIAEIHTIAEIDGNRVRFVNPIHFNLRIVESEPFTLERYESIRECGIEDIRFTGHWDSFPEEFVHHKNGIHDSGWDAVSMENVEDSWIRRCEFRNWNECVFTRNAYKMTIEDVNVHGQEGAHVGARPRRLRNAHQELPRHGRPSSRPRRWIWIGEPGGHQLPDASRPEHRLALGPVVRMPVRQYRRRHLPQPGRPAPGPAARRPRPRVLEFSAPLDVRLHLQLLEHRPAA